MIRGAVLTGELWIKGPHTYPRSSFRNCSHTDVLFRSACQFLTSLGVDSVCCGCWTDFSGPQTRLDLLRGFRCGDSKMDVFLPTPEVSNWPSLLPAGQESKTDNLLGSLLGLPRRPECFRGKNWTSLSSILKITSSGLSFLEHLGADTPNEPTDLLVTPSCFRENSVSTVWTGIDSGTLVLGSPSGMHRFSAQSPQLTRPPTTQANQQLSHTACHAPRLLSTYPFKSFPPYHSTQPFSCLFRHPRAS